MTLSFPTAVLVTAVLLLGLAASASAQDEEEPPQAPQRIDCSSPDHRAFDFWVGEWDVYNPAGEKVGENTISVIEGGCALREQWRATDGSTGQSLNYYDASTGRWYQTWVAQSGRPLRLVGGPEDGSMVMGMEAPNVHHRITWTPNEDGSVRQFWEISTDGGEAWQVAFDGEYRPDPGE